MPSGPFVLANAHGNMRAGHDLPIETHGDEKELAFRTYGEVNIRVAHGSILFGPNVHALPTRTVISAAPQIRSHCGIGVITGDEKRSVSQFNHHGLARKKDGGPAKNQWDEYKPDYSKNGVLVRRLASR